MTTLSIQPGDLSLATDLYQLTMAAAYHQGRVEQRATFELFVRRLPPHRSFLVFGGLEQALASLVALRFAPAQIDYLRSLPAFSRVDDDFFDRLATFRFRGDVWAMPEGSVFFAQEPVLRLTSSLFEAQLVETLLLSIVNFQTTIASKAARIRMAAGAEVSLAEFGGRRAHGPQAATWAARAAFLAGFDSTSNVLAGQRLGIPVVGTMAHSFVMAFEEERQAFERYHAVFPGHTIFLVDTYDTLDGVRTALSLEVPFAGVRLDSGDLDSLSREVRRLLDSHGREEARIFASGDLNEEKIRRLRRGGAPIDAFGVGTQLSTSADSPFTPGIYKLVEVERQGRRHPRLKASAGKATYPGSKQVFRTRAEGSMRGDRIAPAGQGAGAPGEEPLLEPVMRAGEVVVEGGLEAARRQCRRELASLPPFLRTLEEAGESYPVTVDPGLERLLHRELERLSG